MAIQASIRIAPAGIPARHLRARTTITAERHYLLKVFLGVLGAGVEIHGVLVLLSLQFGNNQTGFNPLKSSQALSAFFCKKTGREFGQTLGLPELGYLS